MQSNEVRTFFGSRVSENASQIVLDTNNLCIEKLRKLNKQTTVTESLVKKWLHWETLSIFIAYYDKNPELVNEICKKFKSPTKWVLTVEDFRDCYSGYCECADFGRIDVELGVLFTDCNGNKVRIQ